MMLFLFAMLVYSWGNGDMLILPCCDLGSKPGFSMWVYHVVASSDRWVSSGHYCFLTHIFLRPWTQTQTAIERMICNSLLYLKLNLT